MLAGLVTAWRLASWPTNRSPVLVKATTDGMVRPPSAEAMTVGSPPSMTATTEFVVPRSMPMILPMLLVSPWCLGIRKRNGRWCTGTACPPGSGDPDRGRRPGPVRRPRRGPVAGRGRGAGSRAGSPRRCGPPAGPSPGTVTMASCSRGSNGRPASSRWSSRPRTRAAPEACDRWRRCPRTTGARRPRRAAPRWRGRSRRRRSGPCGAGPRWRGPRRVRAPRPSGA